MLVVDDSTDNLDFCALVGGLLNYDVKLAHDVEEAMVILDAGFKPQVVLLDLMMPVKDGFQFRAEQGVDPKISNIPVIIMSANGSISASKELGMVAHYLNKPIDLDALLESINRFLTVE